MDAKELTVRVRELENIVKDLQGKVEFLERQYNLQEMIINDMRIDVQMMQKR